MPIRNAWFEEAALPVFRCAFFTASLLLGWMSPDAHAAPLEIAPFYTFNQNPLVQIYGLPAPESATVQPPGHFFGLLALDVANSYHASDNPREKILLDGEGERVTFALRYGAAPGLEFGADLPLVGYSGGIFDGFIEGWHRVFGLPQGNRTSAPEGRLLFRYESDGEERLRMDRSSFGIGDLRLTGGWQLYHDGSEHAAALALRGSLKLPTGDSSRLAGSGSTDLALWLSGSDDFRLPGAFGRAALFGAAGAMVMSDGDVLREQRENLAAFGTLGFGWSPSDRFALKTQFSSHTPFYRGSDLAPLASPSVQWLFGGTYAFSPRTSLDIALSEDISVGTSPDVALHLGLGHRF